MGMAPLAMYLSANGYAVEAFDDFFREPLRAQLEKAGVRIINEPYPLEKPDYVVRSSAVQASDSRLLSFETQDIKPGEFWLIFANPKKLSPL